MVDQINSSIDLQKGLRIDICFDLDGVVFSRSKSNDYSQSLPNFGVIKLIRELHNQGHNIIFCTARGSKTDLDWTEETKKQLTKWDIPYDQLLFGKPAADFYVDDRHISLNELQDLFFAKNQ